MEFPMRQKMPTMVLQGMTEDSRIPGAAASQNEFIKLLFPLPQEDLAIGESSKVPGKMPFNAYGSLLWVEGNTTLTLQDYVMIDNHVCAKFDMMIDISKLDVPEELKGEYRCSTKGVGVLYFNTEDRCFQSGEMALIMSARTDAEVPSPFGKMRMSMDSDNFLQFTRNREKEKEANKK
jgi:hypothetical protein